MLVTLQEARRLWWRSDRAARRETATTSVKIPATVGDWTDRLAWVAVAACRYFGGRRGHALLGLDGEARHRWISLRLQLPCYWYGWDAGLFTGSSPEKLRALLKSWEVAVMSPWRPKRNRSSRGRGEMEESSGWRGGDGRRKLPSSAGLSRRSHTPHMWQFSFCSLGLTLNISLLFALQKWLHQRERSWD